MAKKTIVIAIKTNMFTNIALNYIYICITNRSSPRNENMNFLVQIKFLNLYLQMYMYI